MKERHYNKIFRKINTHNACIKECVEYVKETGTEFGHPKCSNPEHDPNWKTHVDGDCISHKCLYCKGEVE